MPFFMKIENVTGSSTSKNHQGWITLESLDFGMRRSISVHPGMTNNRETSTPKIGDFVIIKSMDKSSPHLFEKSCTGTSLGEVIIHACRTSDSLEEYLEYKLQDVMISHYDVNGASPESQDTLSETLHLNFTQVQMKYVPRNSENKSESPIISGYDVSKATKM